MNSSISEGAAAVERADENTIRALGEIGMPAAVKSIAEGCASLAAAVLLHCRSRFAAKGQRPIANRAGYIAACFRKPADMSFELREGRWFEPADEAKERTERQRQRVQTIATDQNAKREAERARREKEMALHAARIARWDARPEPEKEKIRALVEPIYRGLDHEGFTFRSRCMAISEQLEAEGRL